MRRKDREITEKAKIDEIIRACQICRVGFNAEGQVYIVPLNFGYREEGDGRIFYFHGAKEGRKHEIMRLNPHVGFELDTNYELKTGPEACNYSAFYQSVIGTGIVTAIETTEAKRDALQVIMEHVTGRNDWTFPDAHLLNTGVFKLTVQELSCKEHSR